MKEKFQPNSKLNIIAAFMNFMVKQNPVNPVNPIQKISTNLCHTSDLRRLTSDFLKNLQTNPIRTERKHLSPLKIRTKN